jgi:uncharacterized protein
MTAPVFLDTVGLIAVWDEADPWHELTVPVYERLIRDRRRLTTSTYVLLECGNAAAKKPLRDDVTRLFQRLDRLGLLLVPSPREHTVAWSAYSRRLNAAAGLVDQYSFVIMNTTGITEAFTHDQHFRAAGFITLFQTRQVTP